MRPTRPPTSLRCWRQRWNGSTIFALGAAIVPLQDSIADLRRVQYEQQGQKSANTETKIERRLSAGQMVATITAAFVALSAIVSLAVYLGLHK